MNTTFIKSVPTGNYEEVSIETTGWEARFLKLVQERKPIKYDTATMPTLPKEIKDELGRQSYVCLVLESDHDKYFLAPRPQAK